MTAHQAQAGDQGWGWVRRGGLELGGCLTFARDVAPGQVIEAFGMDPGAALLLPAARLSEALRYPVYSREAEVTGPWIRVGRAGEWAFAIEETLMGYLDDVGLRLSERTDAAVVAWTAKPTYEVRYLAGGRW